MTTAYKRQVMDILTCSPEFNPSEVSVAEEVIDSYLEQTDDYAVYVALDNGKVTGYVGYGPTPLTESTWDIYWLAVSPAERGRGTGGALLEYAQSEIMKRGGRLIVIETSGKPEYENTRRFYTKHGYRVISRIDDFYGPGDDKIIFGKRPR